MHKLKLFYITFVLFLSLTGCYTDRRQLENSNFHTEDQQQDEQDRIIPSYTTLYEAIENKDLEKAIALLQEALKGDKEVDLMQRDGQGRSLLHFAIVNTDPSQEVWYLGIVSLLIKLKQDVNAGDNEANTPLHIAARKGLFLVVESLVKNGANVYAENKYGKIPLHCAVEGGNIEVVRMLINQNKTVEKILRTLILTEPDSYIDKKDKDGRTPLYLAMYKLGLCIGNPAFGNPEKCVLIIKLLVASGADVHTKDKYSMTLLHMAAKAGCVEMVRMLLEEKVEVNSYHKNGSSPLELAICCSSVSPRAKDYLTVMNMLIEAGANVYHKNIYNRNLLHIAAAHGNVEIVKLLIYYKVKINFKDNDGYTPLQLAVISGFDKIAIYLIKQGANINPTNSHSLLHDAIRAISAFYPGRKDACIALIKYLISSGVGINNVDGQGDTPLHLAVQKLCIAEFSEVVNLLIAAGASIHTVNNRGNTPLFYMKPYIREVLL